MTRRTRPEPIPNPFGRDRRLHQAEKLIEQHRKKGLLGPSAFKLRNDAAGSCHTAEAWKFLGPAEYYQAEIAMLPSHYVVVGDSSTTADIARKMAG